MHRNNCVVNYHVVDYKNAQTVSKKVVSWYQTIKSTDVPIIEI